MPVLMKLTLGEAKGEFPRRALTAIAILIAMACTGCNSVRRGSPLPFTPAFTEQEIRSKAWTATNGQELRLLAWKIYDSQIAGRLLVSQYGATNIGIATCAEIYRVVEEPAGYRWVFRPEIVPQAGASREAFEYVSAAQRFVLLEHDYDVRGITNLTVRESKDRVSFQFARETIPGSARMRDALHYTTYCDRSCSIVPRAEAWTSNIVDK